MRMRRRGVDGAGVAAAPTRGTAVFRMEVLCQDPLPRGFLNLVFASLLATSSGERLSEQDLGYVAKEESRRRQGRGGGGVAAKTYFRERKVI